MAYCQVFSFAHLYMSSKKTRPDTRQKMRPVRDIPRFFFKMLTDGHTDTRTYGQTDGRTDTPSYRDATAHLKRFSKSKSNGNLVGFLYWGMRNYGVLRLKCNDPSSPLNQVRGGADLRDESSVDDFDSLRASAFRLFFRRLSRSKQLVT